MAKMEIKAPTGKKVNPGVYKAVLVEAAVVTTPYTSIKLSFQTADRTFLYFVNVPNKPFIDQKASNLFLRQIKDQMIAFGISKSPKIDLDDACQDSTEIEIAFIEAMNEITDQAMGKEFEIVVSRLEMKDGSFMVGMPASRINLIPSTTGEFKNWTLPYNHRKVQVSEELDMSLGEEAAV